MRLPKGSAQIFRVPLVDQTGAVITNLPSATDVRFMVKKKKTDLDVNAIVSKNIGNGVAIDTPVQGTVEITFDSQDTSTVAVGQYYMGLQIQYSPTNYIEVFLNENGARSDIFYIDQDVVHAPAP